MHHINVIIIALRVVIFVSATMALFNFRMAYKFISEQNPKHIKNYFTEFFSLDSQLNHNNIWLASTFAILFGLLLTYLIYGAVWFYKCLLRIEKGKMFYSTQGEDFKKAGAAIIIFAKLKYLLVCAMGLVVYFELDVLFTQLLPFLGIYLIGKLILLMSYMAEKGEFIKEENELTI